MRSSSRTQFPPNWLRKGDCTRVSNGDPGAACEWLRRRNAGDYADTAAAPHGDQSVAASARRVRHPDSVGSLGATKS